MFTKITSNYWNKLQIVFQCCGLDGYTDLANIEQGVVRIHKPGCGRNFSMENIYQRGCEEKLTKNMKHIIETRVEQIFYWVVSVVFLSSATLITFFSVKTCMINNDIHTSYLLVSDDKCWSDDSAKKHGTFNGGVQDKFFIEITINRKP